MNNVGSTMRMAISLLLNNATASPASYFSYRHILSVHTDFAHEHRGRSEPGRVGFNCGAGVAIDLPETQHARRAGLDAGGAADALGVGHGEAFVGEIHDVDAL